MIAVVRPDGSLVLGPDAARLGYQPGTAVRVIPTRAGTLILAIDDSPVIIEAPARPLPPRGPSRVLGTRVTGG